MSDGPYISGRTTDGRNVWAGLYRLHDQEGLPLAVSFSVCFERGDVPAVGQVYIEARMAGLSSRRALSLLDEAIADCGQSPEWVKGVRERLQKLEILWSKRRNS